MRDAAGNLYGTAAYNGPSGNGVVFKLDPSGNLTVLVDFNGTNGSSPWGSLIMDAAGNFYGVTQYGGSSGRGVVFKVDPSGNETVLYNFLGRPDGATPWSRLTMDAAGNLYGVTAGGGTYNWGTVFKLDTSGNETVLHSFTRAEGSPYAGLAIDAGGNLYGTAASGPYYSGTVFKLDTSGNMTVLWNFTGGGDGGTPYGDLIIDASGNLYGTTQLGGSDGYGTVFKLDPSGNETVLWNFVGAPDGDSPSYGSLLLDAAGNLYGTTEYGGSFGYGVVFKLDPSGHETILWSFDGTDGSSPQAGVIQDAAGNLYGTTQIGGPAYSGTVFEIVAPTAVAGMNQTITVDQTVHLDGSGSFSPNTLPANLQYAWSFSSRPAGSAAVLSNANTATPTFVADAIGNFVVELVVTDPGTTLSSAPSQATISSVWSSPTANAGAAQSVPTGSLVNLDGTGSSDPNGLPLTYNWSFVSQPSGSAATITPGTSGLASFTADVAGLYTVQLVVSDLFGSSQPSTVIISATTAETVQQLIEDAINYIAAMPVSHFDAPGHGKALSNQMQDAIVDIRNGKASQAIGKLTNTIIRTDGFPLRNAADGNGPGMDWITNLADQEFVYNKLTAAVAILNQP